MRCKCDTRAHFIFLLKTDCQVFNEDLPNNDLKCEKDGVREKQASVVVCHVLCVTYLV